MADKPWTAIRNHEVDAEMPLPTWTPYIWTRRGHDVGKTWERGGV